MGGFMTGKKKALITGITGQDGTVDPEFETVD